MSVFWRSWELSPEEKEQAKEDMAKMLDYIDTLNELDTSGVEPMSHVFPVHNVFREDVVTNGDERDAMLAGRAGRRKTAPLSCRKRLIKRRTAAVRE